MTIFQEVNYITWTDYNICNGNSIQPDPTKITAVRNLKNPLNISEVR